MTGTSIVFFIASIVAIGSGFAVIWSRHPVR